LLQLERAFLNPLGQGGDHTDLKYELCFSLNDLFMTFIFRHIIYAPAKGNQYAAAGFPAISDAIASGDITEINNQVAIATYFVRGASSTLKQFNKFIS
jgi:hypothetical protein